MKLFIGGGLYAEEVGEAGYIKISKQKGTDVITLNATTLKNLFAFVRHNYEPSENAKIFPLEFIQEAHRNSYQRAYEAEALVAIK